MKILAVDIFPIVQQSLVGEGLTLRHTTLSRTPLDERSARRRDFYVTTHNISQETDSDATGGIRTRHPRKQYVAEDTRLRPHGHWDRLCIF